ncbi:MAG: hypothetical protein ACR2PF_05590 [Rhizobiaceae bacterium]
MFHHAATGYAGNGTLCGALGVASAIINLVAYDEETLAHFHMTQALMDWYADFEFPSSRFDHMSQEPGQVRVLADSPLCHISVSQWSLTAGVEIDSRSKYERCAKTAGEVVFTTVGYLNKYFEGGGIEDNFDPDFEMRVCLSCHAAESYFTGYTSSANNQQGRMECSNCHSSHMAPLFERVNRTIPGRFSPGKFDPTQFE